MPRAQQDHKHRPLADSKSRSKVFDSPLSKSAGEKIVTRAFLWYYKRTIRSVEIFKKRRLSNVGD